MPSTSHPTVSRRCLLTGGTAAAFTTALGTPSRSSAADEDSSDQKFRFCLNFSTIRGQNLTLPEEIDVAGNAGYDAIEPWLGNLNRYIGEGGSLKDLRKRIEDHGLTVESAIGFASWIVNDEAQRQKGLEEAKRDMDSLAQIGGKRIAAPPAGVPRDEVVDLDDAASRYARLLEIGDVTGVTPQIEMWGGNPTIGTVSKAIYIAVASGHPKACFLGDVYHSYKGGSSFESLRLLSPAALQVYHFNDYPADPPRETINDGHRVHVGDGIAPIKDIISIFRSVGAYPVLSLELFNKTYWEQDALETAKTGLEKMQASVG